MAYEVLDTVQFGVFSMGGTPVARYRFADIDSNADLVAVGSAGGQAVGVVALDDAVADQETKIQVGGIARVEVGTGDVTAGAIVQALANGTITDAASGDYPVGRAVEAGAAGEIISVILMPSAVPLA